MTTPTEAQQSAPGLRVLHVDGGPRRRTAAHLDQLAGELSTGSRP